MTQLLDMALALALGCLALVTWWLPVIVGKRRGVPNLGSIAVITGLLGWLLIPWAVALALACRDVPDRKGPEAPKNVLAPKVRAPENTVAKTPRETRSWE
jgi:Superinfection immunity protein